MGERPDRVATGDAVRGKGGEATEFIERERESPSGLNADSIDLNGAATGLKSASGASLSVSPGVEGLRESGLSAMNMARSPPSRKPSYDQQ